MYLRDIYLEDILCTSSIHPPEEMLTTKPWQVPDVSPNETPSTNATATRKRPEWQRAIDETPRIRRDPCDC